MDRERVRPFANSGFPWHDPDRVRAPGQGADAWWDALAPTLARAFRHLGEVDDTRAAELAAEVRGTFLEPGAWIFFDDVVPALRRLAEQGWRHIVVSNHVPELPLLMEQLGLASFFRAIHTSAVTGIEKPNRRAFVDVVTALPAGSQVWMIGDNPVADVQGAESAGIPAILVRSDAPGVLRRCDDLSDLEALLERA